MEPAETWMHVNVVLHARLIEAERLAYISGDQALAAAHARTLEFMFDRRDLDVQHGDVVDRLKIELDTAETQAREATAKCSDLQEQLQYLDIVRD